MAISEPVKIEAIAKIDLLRPPSFALVVASVRITNAAIKTRILAVRS